MRILEKIKENTCHSELFISVIIIVLIISALVYIVNVLFVSEKCFIKNELSQQAIGAVCCWNELKLMKPDGKVSAHSYNESKREVHIYIEDQEHIFEIDSLVDVREVNMRVDCDLNLRDPISLDTLERLVEARLSEETLKIPVVYRLVDSLGNTRKVYPKGNTRYMDMEEAECLKLGFISGEKIQILFDYSWKDFYMKFWWRVLGLVVGGNVVIILIINFVMQIRKHRRMKMLQERVFRQRLHDLGNPISVIEIVLHSIYEENPDVFKKENERRWFETGVNTAVMVKQEIAETLNMAVMLYTKRVEWEEMNLQEELNKLASEFKLANRGKKEVNIGVNVLPGQFKLSKQLVYAIRNLVDNAVKYSGDVAEVTITVYRERKYLIITVADRGKGIAEKDLPYIFEEYWRVGKEKKTTGYGLGLASVRKIVRRHGGKVFVVSSLGSGTKFTIKIHDHGKKNKAFVCRGSIGNA